MSEPITVVVSDSVALCGFDRCRAPLPGPGPKGGRPFEFCPDRTWPGGKTCKQLAAAQDALRDAIGQAATHRSALTDAAAAISETANRVAGPVAELLSALRAISTTAAEEMTAAAAQVQAAEAVAAEERGLRQAAEHRTEQANTQRDQALAAATHAEEEAGHHREAASQAQAAAQQAITARGQAELAQARAEATAETDRGHTDRATQQVQHERTRADAAIRDLSSANEHIAALTAQRDAARTELAAAHTTADETAARLRVERDAATAAADTARQHLSEREDQLRELVTTHNERFATLRDELGRARENLATARHDGARHRADLDQERLRLHALREVLSNIGPTTSNPAGHPTTVEGLCGQLLAVLLPAPQSPPAESTPGHDGRDRS